MILDAHWTLIGAVAGAIAGAIAGAVAGGSRLGYQWGSIGGAPSVQAGRPWSLRLSRHVGAVGVAHVPRPCKEADDAAPEDEGLPGARRGRADEAEADAHQRQHHQRATAVTIGRGARPDLGDHCECGVDAEGQSDFERAAVQRLDVEWGDRERQGRAKEVDELGQEEKTHGARLQPPIARGRAPAGAATALGSYADLALLLLIAC